MEQALHGGEPRGVDALISDKAECVLKSSSPTREREGKGGKVEGTGRGAARGLSRISATRKPTRGSKVK